MGDGAVSGKGLWSCLDDQSEWSSTLWLVS